MTGKTAAPDPEGQRILSISDLHGKLDQLLNRQSAPAPAAPPAGDSSGGHGSVQAQVDQAVRDAQEKERAKTDSERREAEINKRFEALEQKTEQSPREHNPLTRFLWGNE